MGNFANQVPALRKSQLLLLPQQAPAGTASQMGVRGAKGSS